MFGKNFTLDKMQCFKWEEFSMVSFQRPWIPQCHLLSKLWQKMGQFQRQCRDKMWNKMSSGSGNYLVPPGVLKRYLCSPSVKSADLTSQNLASITNKSWCDSDKCEKLYKYWECCKKTHSGGFFPHKNWLDMSVLAREANSSGSCWTFQGVTGLGKPC